MTEIICDCGNVYKSMEMKSSQLSGLVSSRQSLMDLAHQYYEEGTV